MDIDFDVDKHQFKGKQVLKYTNNSPDTLDKVFYHLYFNAFQPGSMMDERSRTIQDPDPRVGERIAALTESEIGFQKVNSLKQDGKSLDYVVEGTILEVKLDKAILPGASTVFEMDFLGQVPLQIRRSGRDNKEGVDYSMTQWYPKLAEYDFMGWSANPYIGREFHGVWGDFEVNIKMDSKYKMGATGMLQNADKIGFGFQGENVEQPKLKKKVTWNWKADNVIDFAWVADRDFTHISKKAHDGTMMNFIFQPGEETTEKWEMLPEIMDEALKFMNANYGKYQFPQYTFIQGGDGGMEYPMITLITGERSLGSLVGVCIHEWMHSWYQFTLATNESLYSWMDEGFTSFASAEIMNHLATKGLIPGARVRDNVHAGSTMGYAMFSQSGMEEALSTHSDHYNTNTAYGRGSYTKGSVFLSQLEYIIGEKPFRKGLLRYYDTWKFKHPTPNDIIRIMEKESGIELDWYKEYFVYTTKFIDYGIVDVIESNGGSKISLERVGEMPMPVEVLIKKKDGSSELHYIPMRIMRGDKDFGDQKFVQQKDWPWTHRSYEFMSKVKASDIESIRIDPSLRMADVVMDNNEWMPK
ncbi:peptidase M1 [Portibacter lacus]|uniref:Peptidase M1 n=2 Tax=Portibacter lacus TaxID=1099794 RepID=A0AA37SKI0_9BACT|nr:peptidase M1 [Portibacter lacus]